ncbi:MAG: hypothetical protein ABSG65_16495 [Bryobacteraceae bacterium]|jgi:hypothetical protein
MDREKVERIDPIARGPRDFVDEWLTRPWEQSARWTEPYKRAALARWHRMDNSIDFSNTAMHCRQSPDLWQIMSGYDVVPFDTPLRYFLVRWQPPYRFTLVDINDRPWAGCTERDPKADEYRTLFAGQDWR